MKIISKANFPSNDSYHSNSNISFSSFKVFVQNPLQFEHRFLKGNGLTQTPAMVLGSLIHAIVLEPSTIGKEWIVCPSMPLRSQKDKQAFLDYLKAFMRISDDQEDELLKQSANELRSNLDDLGLQIVSDQQMKLAEDVRDELVKVMPATRETDERNVECAFTAKIAGVKCQCKCDLVDDENRIWDIKTTGNLASWVNQMQNGSMLLGDAFYRHIIRIATGVEVPAINYVGVSTQAPHEVIVMRYPELMLDACANYIESKLQELQDCIANNHFPGMLGDKDVHEIELKDHTMNFLLDQVCDQEM